MNSYMQTGTNTNTHFTKHTEKTDQEGTLGVEGVGATHVDASIAQKLQQTDVVMTVNLQGETNTQE